jgi:hypothetical protein
MRRRCRAPLFSLLILGVLLGGWARVDASVGVVSARVGVAAYAGMQDAPVISCDVSNALVYPGVQVVVRARVTSKETEPWRYSFSSSVGKLLVFGVGNALLDTAGMTPGPIHLTCEAAGASGVKVSAVKEITLAPWPVEGAENLSAAELQRRRRLMELKYEIAMMQQQIATEQTLQSVHSAAQAQRAESSLNGLRAQQAQLNALEAQQDVLNADGMHVGGWGGGGGTLAPHPSNPARPGPGAGGGGHPPEGARTTNEGARAPLPKHDAAAGAGKLVKPQTGAGKTAGAKGDEAADGVYAEVLTIQKWESQLKMGRMDYLFPAKVSLPGAFEASVLVHGYEDVAAPVDAGARSVGLKVSPKMRVELSSDQPDEFKIEPSETDPVQVVPIDGAAEWRWRVTPKEPAQDGTLTIRAVMVYPEGANKEDIQLPSKTVHVSVQVGSAWAWMKYLFWNDPVGLVKYLLPGGAGFAFVAGLVTWWWKRRHPEEKKGESEAPTAAAGDG